MFFAFVALGLVSMSSDWLGRTSLKSPILCRVGHKTLTQSLLKQAEVENPGSPEERPLKQM